MAHSFKSAEYAPPQPPAGDLQLPCSFEDALDIFPLCKPISPDMPFGGSRWQVLDMKEDGGEESATGGAEATADESLEHAEQGDEQAFEGDEVLAATGITSLSTLWTAKSTWLQPEDDNQLAPCATTGPRMDESFAMCSSVGDGAALKKLQKKTPWTKHEDQAILEGVKVPPPPPYPPVRPRYPDQHPTPPTHPPPPHPHRDAQSLP